MPQPTDDMEAKASVIDVVLSQRKSHNTNFVNANGEMPLDELPYPPALTRR
jgi:DNA replication licensing factor MCM7